MLLLIAKLSTSAGGEKKNKKNDRKELEEVTEVQATPEIPAGEENKHTHTFVKGKFFIQLLEAFSDFSECILSLFLPFCRWREEEEKEEKQGGSGDCPYRKW